MRTILITLLLLFSAATSSQAYDWRTEGKPIREHFDTLALSGDPQNFSLGQDEKGSIYVANGKALLIYNGQDWQVLRQGEGKLILSYALGDDGRIYAGPLGDLGYFESDKQGRWQFVSLLDGVQAPEFATVIHVMRFGEHILYSTNKVFFHYHPQTGLSWEDDIPGPFKAIEMDGEAVIPSVNGKVYRYNLEDRLVSEDKNFPQAARSKSMLRLRNDDLLLYNSRKLFFMDKTGEVQRFKTTIDDWLSRGEIVDIEEDAWGNLVIANRYAGIAIVDRAGELVRFYGPEHGLESTQLYDILLDRENNLWITFQDGGLARVEIGSNVSEYSDDENYLFNINTVRFKDKYFISSADGLFTLKPASSPQDQAKFVKAPELNSVVYYFLNTGDSLLVSHERGVSTMDVDANGNIAVTPVYKTGQVYSEHIQQMIQSRYKPNIVYGIRATGLVRFRKREGAWEFDGELKGFEQYVTSIVEDKPDHLWLGTHGGAFYRISQLDKWPEGKFATVSYPDPEIVTKASVFTLGTDILFSNGAQGQIRSLQTDSNTFGVSTHADWQSYDIRHIVQLAHTKKGNAWIHTNANKTGEARIGLLEQTANKDFDINFSLLDHLRLQAVNSLYTTEQGELWINSQGRVLRLRNAESAPEASLAKPVIDKVVELGSGETLFTNTRFDQSSPTIQLKREQGAVSVYVSAMNYRHRDTLEYRYRLSNKNSAWSDWSPNPYAELTKLPAFESHLDVQYRTNRTNLSPIANFDFYRTPWWYQYTWARLLLVFLVLAAITMTAVIYARYRNRFLRARARELESRVRERTSVIREQNKQLQSMNDAKSRFFTNLAHEFRTPLTLAIGTLRELTSASEENNTERDYLNIALKNNLHMERLLTQVLDINRLENNALPANVVNMDVVSLIHYCVQRFRAQAQKRQIDFVLSGIDKELRIDFDPDHFEKIILNLLSNALKYSPQGSDIFIRLEEREDEVNIWVRDQGPGIDPEDEKHIFDRYYQGKSSSYTLQPGTGIGLALVKELLALHKGEIKLVSSDSGACFQLSLHKATSGDSPKQSGNTSALPVDFKIASQASDNENEQDVFLSSHGTKTILIVDDNVELRQFLRAQLQNTYNIVEAEDGRLAYDLAVSTLPDLIVSDIMMPVKDGLTLARELKSTLETAHIPLILLTAKSSKWETVEGLQYGADDYLGKPFDTAELVARIASMLNQKQRVARALYAKFKKQLARKNPVSSSHADTFLNSKSGLPQKILAAIDENLGNPDCKLDTLSEHLNMHWATLTRRTKEYFDCTPIQLLRQRRLELSLVMLRRGKGSVSEVAYACGFDSLAYFSRCFSQEYSVPPTRHREVKETSLVE